MKIKGAILQEVGRIQPYEVSKPLVVLIYQTVFSELRIGYAATQSIFFIFVLVFVTVLQRKFLNSRYEK